MPFKRITAAITAAVTPAGKKRKAPKAPKRKAAKKPRKLVPYSGKAKKAKAPDRKGVGGRPKLGKEHLTLTAQKPWESMGISERTYFRKKAAGTLPSGNANVGC